VLSGKAKTQFQKDPSKAIKEEIKAFTRSSPLNRMPGESNQPIFDEPLIQFADGNDPIFNEYKKIIAPSHLTPREALAKATGKSPEELPARLSVISWILPITEITRRSNRRETKKPSRFWSYTRYYGEKFNGALRQHVVDVLNEMGYLATAPFIQPYFEEYTNEKGKYSNWSERHAAYAAGLGTFSLSDGFITERGIAHRCGSVVTDLELEASQRLAKDPYSNCLFYVDSSCKACIIRCPAGAVTENGHDKIKCFEHMQEPKLLKKYQVEKLGCGLCQTKVPCEYRNPTRKVSPTPHPR